MIDKHTVINVLNYNESSVCLKTQQREYLCRKLEDGRPSITPLEFSEIEELNSTTSCFRTGLLFFEKELEQEIYEKLRIFDWQEILTNEDIEDIILHPNLSKLEKLLKIDNLSYFTRVRGVFYTLKNSNKYDISMRIEKIINERYNEIRRNQRKTSIELVPKDAVAPINNAEFENIKKQNIELEEKLNQMQKLLEQLAMNTNAATVTTVTTDTNKTAEVETDTAKKNDEDKKETVAKKVTKRKYTKKNG